MGNERLTKREAAERNVKWGGDEKGTEFNCGECPLKKECLAREDFVYWKITDRRKECALFCKQWLADNPEKSEWQELKIDDFPRDILKWEIHGNDRTHYVEYDSPEYEKWVPTDCFDTIEVLQSMKNNGKFRYRKRQPEKKDRTLPLCEVKIDTEKIQKILNESIKNGEIKIVNLPEKKELSDIEKMETEYRKIIKKQEESIQAVEDLKNAIKNEIVDPILKKIEKLIGV